MLDYKRVLELFIDFSRTPRMPENMAPVVQYLREFALKNELEFYADEAFNVLIKKNASQKNKYKEALILQAHTDMVCVKSDKSNHDFSKDPIEIIFDSNGWIHANETSLGADDGIGVALILAILENKTIEHPDLECIFTACEETNMSGAEGFDKNLLKGHYMINLDNEEESSLITSSAGIADTRSSFFYKNEGQAFIEGQAFKLIEISLEGLLGGHSGIEINLPRLNSIVVMTQYITLIKKHAKDNKSWIGLVSFNGGTHMNSIPNNANCVIAIKPEYFNEFCILTQNFFNTLIKNSYDFEPNLHYNINDISSYINDSQISYFKENFVDCLIDFIIKTPNGVIKKDDTIIHLVESSCNIGRIITKKDCVTIWVSYRSANNNALDILLKNAELSTSFLDGNFELGFIQYGWPFNKRTKLIPFLSDIYSIVFERNANITGIHAGLECGTFAKDIKNADIVSLGSNVISPHTISEKAEISSIEKMTNYLSLILEKFYIL